MRGSVSTYAQFHVPLCRKGGLGRVDRGVLRVGYHLGARSGMSGSGCGGERWPSHVGNEVPTPVALGVLLEAILLRMGPLGA